MGAVIAGVIVLVVIGSGRWFQPKLTIESYFNESVQGLDVGSKLKYRGVVIGEVKRIGFTYNKYQQDRMEDLAMTLATRLGLQARQTLRNLLKRNRMGVIRPEPRITTGLISV